MSQKTMVEALNLALHQAMEADDRVVVLGEDVAQTGGVFRVTAGLLDRFGENRIVDTPLAEAGIVGSAIGMAVYGMLPVVEIQFDVFVYPGFEQIVVHAARYAWRTKGEVPASIVIRIPYGGGVRAPELHSDSPEALFAHVPGLKVVCPTTPTDARDMLLAAIEDPDPVIFMEPKRIYRAGREDVSGRASVHDRQRTNGHTSGVAVEGPDRTRRRRPRDHHLRRDRSALAGGGRPAGATSAASRRAVVDLRSLYPARHRSDRDSRIGVRACPRRARGTAHAGLGAEVSSLIHERCMLDLEAPVLTRHRVTTCRSRSSRTRTTTCRRSTAS